MILYRITLAVHADKLAASGNPARWNTKYVRVIYTSSSKSLACLENIVHRNSLGLNAQFKVIIIEVPAHLKIEKINEKSLQPGWQEFQNIPQTRKMGDDWIAKGVAAILQVPSVIIPGEFNYLLNPRHEDFSKIKYIGNEPFEFVGRLKG